MNINSKLEKNILILMPQGRIDYDSADAFSAALQPHLDECKEDGTALVLDFTAVEYISSVGLRVLMLAARQVKAQNGRIAIANLSTVVKEVFEISRFNKVYKVYDHVDDAMEAVS